jgi:single-stranded DNA-binding protein
MSDEQTAAEPKKRLTHLTGNLGADPKTILSDNVESGKIIKLNLGVPVTNGSKDNPGETFWVDISIFDSKMQARALAELHKGDKIAVVGYLGQREWENKEGVTMKTAQMTAQRMSHLEFWEKVPYVPRETASSAEDWVAPF